MLKQSKMTDIQAIIDQNAIESGALGLLADAIRSATVWPLPRRQPGRKVATVRYLCQVYRQMFERVLAIEGNDGYMDVVSDADSRFEERLERFRREHHGYRAAWQEIMPQLDRVVASNEFDFELICEQINSLLTQIDRHFQRESELISQSSLLDFGDEDD